MRVRLNYGRHGLEVELPEQNVVKCLGYRSAQALADPCDAVLQALRQPIGSEPLASLARGRVNACVVIADITRPVPYRLLLPPVLNTLEASGIARDRILLLVATGLHRPTTREELVEMVGEPIAQGYRIEDHYGERLEEHVSLGTSPNGVPVWIDRRYVEADLKITTGLVEPHFMAGYSGGRKLICPGLAARQTICAWHSPRFLEHPKAANGVLEGNPVHEEDVWIARRAGCDFIVNTVIDAHRQMLFVVAGDMEQAHLAACDFVRNLVIDTIPQPVDVVITSAAGYPLDATYYQSVKGMVAAEGIVRPGGTVILASGMSEGIGSPSFCQIFEEHATLDDFLSHILARPEVAGRIDQWQLEMFAKVRRKATVKVVTDGLPPETLRKLFVEPAPSVEAAVAAALVQYGPHATIAVIPEGPYVIGQVAC